MQLHTGFCGLAANTTREEEDDLADALALGKDYSQTVDWRPHREVASTDEDVQGSEGENDDSGRAEERKSRNKFLAEHPHFDSDRFPPRNQEEVTVLTQEAMLAEIHQSYYRNSARPLIDKRG